MPRWVTAVSPSVLIMPPHSAEFCVILITADVVKTGNPVDESVDFSKTKHWSNIVAANNSSTDNHFTITPL